MAKAKKTAKTKRVTKTTKRGAPKLVKKTAAKKKVAKTAKKTATAE
jgi:hypothetical protein